MRMTYLAPFKYGQGMFCKHERIYGAHRKDTGTNYNARICNPYIGPLTQRQIDVQETFKNAYLAVKAIMGNKEQKDAAIVEWNKQKKDGYKTLRGYLMAREFARLSK